MKEIINKIFNGALCIIGLWGLIYLLSRIPFVIGAAIYIGTIIVLLIIVVIFWIQILTKKEPNNGKDEM